MLLRLPHQGMPFALFGLLQEDAAEREKASTHIQLLPRCMLDAFSQEFLRNHEGQLLANETLATLVACAELAFCEISSVEVGHGRWQQDSRIRSVRTHRDALACTSSNFVLHQARQATRPQPSEKRAKKQPFQPGRRKRPWQQTENMPQMPRTSHGGGGPWRAFVRQESKGKAKLRAADFTALRNDYNALSPTRKEALTIQGHAMTMSRALKLSEPDPVQQAQQMSPKDAEQAFALEPDTKVLKTDS